MGESIGRYVPQTGYYFCKILLETLPGFRVLALLVLPRKKTSLLLPLLKVVGRKRYPIFIDIPHIGGCVSVNFVWMISTMKSFTKASADKQVQTDDNPRASRTVLLSIYMVCGRAMSFHVVS